eukprot:scaffold1321_cov402-Prasinococcus_capsulatus_cf.AAC.1
MVHPPPPLPVGRPTQARRPEGGDGTGALLKRGIERRRKDVHWAISSKIVEFMRLVCSRTSFAPVDATCSSPASRPAPRERALVAEGLATPSASASASASAPRGMARRRRPPRPPLEPAYEGRGRRGRVPHFGSDGGELRPSSSPTHLAAGLAAERLQRAHTKWSRGGQNV